MRFIKGLVLLLLILVVCVIGVAFVLPSHSHVERSIVIARPASQVHAVLNGYKRFNEWSPWAAKDPNAKYTVTGPETGVGAKQAWVGDPKTVGSGSQQITESTPGKSVTTALDFGDMGKATAKFALAPEGQGTKVVWTLDSDTPITFDGKFVNGVMGRWFGLFMDKMVGPDYESGLAKLKALVETFPNVDLAGFDAAIIELQPQKILYVTATTSLEGDAPAQAIGAAYAKIQTYAAANDLKPTGAPLAITNSYDGKSWSFDAALPFEYQTAPDDSEVKGGTTSAGKAVRVVHTGAYEKLPATIEKAYAWIAVQGYKARERLIEEYANDPASTPQEQLVTNVTIPVQ